MSEEKEGRAKKGRERKGQGGSHMSRVIKAVIQGGRELNQERNIEDFLGLKVTSITVFGNGHGLRRISYFEIRLLRNRRAVSFLLLIETSNS